MPTATAQDIATALKMAPYTVRLVLWGGASSARVSEETKARVLAKATELGYAPPKRGRRPTAVGRVRLEARITAPAAIVLDRWRAQLAKVGKDSGPADVLDILIPWAARAKFSPTAKRQ